MENDNLFLEIIKEEMGEDFVLDPDLPVIIADTAEKGPIADILKVSFDCLVIEHHLDAGDYLVSSRFGFELKRDDDSSSMFGDDSHNLFDQIFRLSESVDYAAIIFQGLKSYLEKFKDTPQERGVKGLARYFKNHYSCIETESDYETAEWIYETARSEQKKKKSGHARSVPKKATLYQKKKFFTEGLPQIGSKTFKAINEGYDGNILEFLQDINKVPITYTPSGNLRNVKFKIKGFGAKTILGIQEVLTKKATKEGEISPKKNNE